MAIDYGRKRSGIAVTDPLQIIAGGLATVPGNELVDYIRDYAAREPVDILVVGLPKQMNNEASENMKHVEIFVARFKQSLPDIPVHYHDERFTSIMAHRAMLEGGLKRKKRQDKALADLTSAVIILQSYMESKKTKHA